MPMDIQNNKTQFSYDEARHFIIKSLFTAICHFEEKEYFNLGEGYDILDQRLPRNDLVEFKKLHTAFIFWDRWIYVSNHINSYSSLDDKDFGIQIKDYPVVARRIISDLQSNQDISDPLVIKYFAPRPRNRKSLQEYIAVFRKKLIRLLGHS
jgi:hypothetical protein